MKRFFSVLGSIVVVGFACLSGCVEDRDSDVPSASAVQEITAQYAAGDASLRVIGYGDWKSSDVDFVFEYRLGAHSEELALSFQQWSSSGDATSSEFFAHMDPTLRESALDTLRDASGQVSGSDSVFNHFVTRLLSGNMSHVHSAYELEPQTEAPADTQKCYCYYCKVHHPPYCVGEN